MRTAWHSLAVSTSGRCPLRGPWDSIAASTTDKVRYADQRRSRRDAATAAKTGPYSSLIPGQVGGFPYYWMVEFRSANELYCKVFYHDQESPIHRPGWRYVRPAGPPDRKRDHAEAQEFRRRWRTRPARDFYSSYYSDGVGVMDDREKSRQARCV